MTAYIEGIHLNLKGMIDDFKGNAKYTYLQSNCPLFISSFVDHPLNINEESVCSFGASL